VSCVLIGEPDHDFAAVESPSATFLRKIHPKIIAKSSMHLRPTETMEHNEGQNMPFFLKAWAYSQPPALAT